MSALSRLPSLRRHGHGGAQSDVAGGAGGADLEGAGIGTPGVALGEFGIEGGESAHRQLQADLAFFARRQVDFGEGAQFLLGPENRGGRGVKVDLHDFCASSRAGVFHLEAKADSTRGIPVGNRQVTVDEGCVGKSVAKREERLDLARVVPAVADQDALLVGDFAARAWKIAECGLVFQALGESHGQLA